MFVSNVGDSRAILISRTPDGRLSATPLSSDQTPYRPDERERVKKCGARVLSMDQIEGIEPIHENWGSLVIGDEIDEGGDPPRIWSPRGDYPGTAFTRSIGDVYAEELGVYAEPEILERYDLICIRWMYLILTTIKSSNRDLGPEDLYVVIASDGVFEFLTNQMVAEIIASKDDPLDACKAVVAQSYDLWLQYEVRTDDITIIVLEVEGIAKEDLSKSQRRVSITADVPRMDGAKPVRRVMSREKKKTMIQDMNSVTNDDYDAFDSENDLVSPDGQGATEKSDAERELIASAIKNSFMFQHLNATQRDRVIGVMQKRVVVAGEKVIVQGDQGDRLYIIETGKFEVRVRGSEPDPSGGAVVHVYEATPTFHPSFGELSLMYVNIYLELICVRTETE